MSQENVILVRSAYEAFRRGDIQAIFSILDPQIEVYQSDQVPWGGRYRGHAEVGNFFSKLTQAIESKVDPDHFVDADDHVVAVGYTRGRVRATGHEFEVPAVHIWTIRGGKVIRFEAYIDNPKMRSALGL